MESWIWRCWCCSEAAKTSNINHHHHWPPQQTDQKFDKESARCQDKSTRFHRIIVMTWSNAYHCMGEPSKINHSKSKSMQFVAWENVEKWLRNILLLTQSFTRLQSVMSFHYPGNVTVTSIFYKKKMTERKIFILCSLLKDTISICNGCGCRTGPLACLSLSSVCWVDKGQLPQSGIGLQPVLFPKWFNSKKLKSFYFCISSYIS